MRELSRRGRAVLLVWCVVTILPGRAWAQPPTIYNSRAAWEAAAGSVTTIDFESLAPNGSFTAFDTSLGLSRFGVRFVGVSPNNLVVPFYLRVVSPTFAPIYDWGSGAILHGPPVVAAGAVGGPGSNIRVSLPADVYAAGADIMSILPVASTVTLQVTTTAGTFPFTVPTAAQPTRTFVGIVSTSRILQITGTTASFPALDNFSFSANPLAPGQPLNLTATAVGSTVSIGWDAPTAGGAPTSYLMEAALAPGGPPVGSLGTNTTSLQVPGVPNGTYYVRVRALNGVGQSTPTADVAVTVGPTGSLTLLPLSPVTIGQTVTLTWQVTVPAANYTVSVLSGPGIGAPVAIGAAPCCSISFQIPAGVAPGDYTIVVSGGGLTSAPRTLTVLPTGPFTLAVSQATARAGNVVSFTWPDLGLGTGLQYQLFATGPGGGAPAPLLPAGCCRLDVSIPVVTPGVYTLFVRASNTEQSNTVALTITP